MSLKAATAAGAAAIYLFTGFSDAVDDATVSLAGQARAGDKIDGMIADLAKAQDAYRQATEDTATAQTAASATIVAETEKEFEAKKSLLELELKRQEALIAVNRAALAAKGPELKREIGRSVLTNPDLVASGFADRRVGRLTQIPDDISGVEKTRDVIANSAVGAEVQRLRAELDLTEISADKLREALEIAFGASGGGTAGGLADGDKANAFEKELASVEASIASIVAETAALSTLNPLVDDYGYALARARIEHDLLTAAQEAELDITPKLVDAVGQLADSYAQATVEASVLSEAQERVRESASQAAELSRDVLSGFIDDLKAGTTAADALTNALGRIADKLLDSALDSLFNPAGGSGFFGALGQALGFGGARAAGGPVKAGKSYLVGENGPELFKPHQSGIVIPKLSAGNGVGGGNVSVSLSIDARGSDMGEARFREIGAEIEARVRRQIVPIVRDARSRRAL